MSIREPAHCVNTNEDICVFCNIFYRIQTRVIILLNKLYEKVPYILLSHRRLIVSQDFKIMNQVSQRHISSKIEFKMHKKTI
jgi:hypothetical protein